MEPFSVDLPAWLRVHAGLFATRLVGALVVLVVGLVLARIAGGAARAAAQRTPLGRRELLVNFIARATRTVVSVFAVVVALGELGVDIGPLIAGLGIGGFVVGFAFKDSLSNLAAGFLLLFYEPFDVGDWVEIGGVKGRVVDMTIAATELRAEEGHLAILPNSRIWNAPIVNYSRPATTTATRAPGG